jgi:hypothetical protein
MQGRQKRRLAGADELIGGLRLGRWPGSSWEKGSASGP